MFSILIPTFNNLQYLKFCIRSIKNNSKYTNQIIAHVNIGNDGTIDFLKQENIDYSYTEYNSGICEGINKAAKLAKYDYLLYAHDDFYFCPNWDEILQKEVRKIGHNNFYLSGTMMNEGQIKFNCGNTPNEFNEEKFLNNYKNYNYYDFQGSTWAPSLVHREVWDKVGGLSEEFFPGSGSDPDFNMKLWNEGVRIFQCLGESKVYHFGSITIRKKNDSFFEKNQGSKANKIFLLKWGISIKTFKKFYLKSHYLHNEELDKPKKNYFYYLSLLKDNISRIYYRLIKF
jgi:GT2 family glycosyltransferase